MKLTNSFAIARSPRETWNILLDVPLIAACVPGAELLMEEHDHRYRGKIAVQLGPVNLAFKGIAQLTELDDQQFTAVLKANGMDEKGRGNAGALSNIHINPTESGSQVTIETELQLSGAVAQYGRASGIIEAVAKEIVTAFASNLRARLDERKGAQTSALNPTRRPTANSLHENHLGFGIFVRAFVAWLKARFGRSA